MGIITPYLWFDKGKAFEAVKFYCNIRIGRCIITGEESYMATKYDTINSYIDAFPEEVRAKLYELKECILQVVPDAKELFNYGIPAFALVEDGKREEQIMIAGYKKHVGLYPHPTTMKHFDKELSKYKKGKGSVQFPLNEDLPKELVVEMVKYRYEMIK